MLSQDGTTDQLIVALAEDVRAGAQKVAGSIPCPGYVEVSLCRARQSIYSPIAPSKLIGTLNGTLSVGE